MSLQPTYCGHPDYRPGTVACTWQLRDPDLPLRCSMCGSISGDDFIRLAESGTGLIPSDKDYKVYLRYDTGLPQAREVVDGVNKITGGVRQLKFYFGHMTEEQQRKFVGFLNSKTVRIETPGYFYVMPYFIKRA